MTSASLNDRLPHGGHVDLNLTSGGRVLLLVNSSGNVDQVIAELDAVRDGLQQLQTRTARTQLEK
jgi:hypothetical protein